MFTENFHFEKKLGCTDVRSIMKIMERVSGLHSKEIGCDTGLLIESGFSWIITRTKIKFLSPLSDGVTAVETETVKPNLIDCERNYSLTQSGLERVVGCSKWSVLNVGTRRLVRPGDAGLKYDWTCETGIFGADKMKVRPEDSYIAYKSFTIDNNYIDINNHVNNCEYGGFIDELTGYLQLNKIDSVTVNFVKETLLDENITIEYSLGDALSVRGAVNGETRFLAEITF